MKGFGCVLWALVASLAACGAEEEQLVRIHVDASGAVLDEFGTPFAAGTKLPKAQEGLLTLGKFAHHELQRGGYAYGKVREVALSPHDKDVDPAERSRGFPIVIALRVEEAPGETVEFEATITHDRTRFKSPGLAVIRGRRMGGALPIPLEIPLPDGPSFLERHEKNIKTGLGILAMTQLVRLIRSIIERWWRKRKEAKEAKEATETAEREAEKKSPTGKNGKKKAA